MRYVPTLLVCLMALSPVMAKDAPPTPPSPYAMESIRIELNLSAEQQDKIQALLHHDPLRDAENRIHHADQQRKTDAAILAVLTPEQQTQFQRMKSRRQEDRRLHLKTRALTMLNQSLDLSTVQFQKIGVVLDQYHASIHPVIESSVSPEALMAQLEKSRNERDRAIRAILTPAQQKKFTTLQEHIHHKAPHAHSKQGKWRRYMVEKGCCPRQRSSHSEHHERG